MKLKSSSEWSIKKLVYLHFSTNSRVITQKMCQLLKYMKSSFSLFSSSFQCCVFSSRLMGRGYYVFDRRWDRMRLALQNMVEKHLNAQMWR